jgi:hypothetical protein
LGKLFPSRLEDGLLFVGFEVVEAIPGHGLMGLRLVDSSVRLLSSTTWSIMYFLKPGVKIFLLVLDPGPACLDVPVVGVLRWFSGRLPHSLE